MSAQSPAQHTPLFGIHTVDLEHFFRGIHADADKVLHHGFLHLDCQLFSILLGPLRVVYAISSLGENQHRRQDNRDAVSGQGTPTRLWAPVGSRPEMMQNNRC
ncbi:hypothetical protein NBRC3280_1592 [Acetobacter pasteurianus NBRC 3280]|uniref:Uncharacterized protein n=1 Tax=Acetobacter pasteurianus NBRC 3278 TaxID=1226660 RepID=A0A401X400_ACEPA|nr:hypothetical protein NBRC3277_1667 [Acetobacter pasteurianus NBRC 3277]GCD62585.1 hypothetical protein NBRC3278_1678 [Acetobacter pasteurianus NBRC 3278]GCD68957.1 hypothetical protein NBRC3280_1592 [Acetobacter pasteurianus NBRC 3280]